MRTLGSFRWILAAAGAATLTACGADMGELQSYIDDVKARPGGRIEPLPEVRPAPTFTYEASERRSPFMPDVQQARVSDNPNAVRGPDPSRPREFLEQFPLDTLDMVGTLNIQGTTYGLVQNSAGLITRVTTGDHMVQNYGRITNISESVIQLVEIVPDGLGGFIERPAGVGL
jgi:type IV pilus assembly protein PilP